MSEDPTDRLDEDFAWARKLHQSGMLQDAIESYRAIAAHGGGNPAVHHYLGMALLANDAPEEAIGHLREAVRFDPANADIWNDLGVASEAANALDDAETAFERCLALRQELSEPRIGLAHIFLRQGRPNDALKALEPLAGTGNEGVAALCAQAWLDVARDAQEGADALDAAVHAVDAAVASGDDQLASASHVACFIAAQLQDDRETQTRIAEQLDYLQPDSVPALSIRGRAALRLDHDNVAAADAFERILAQDPENLEALWFRCFLSLRHSYWNKEELDKRRADYASRLATLRDRLTFASGPDLDLAERLLATLSPLLLAYQGEDDVDLQAAYGAMVADIMAARHPLPKPKPASAPDGRIRIAFVSASVFSHSNWKLRRGWIRHLDRSRFHTSIYSLGDTVDWLTEELRGNCDAFHHFPDDFDGALNRLREEQPHIIVYPSIGLSGNVLRLAALRLAPTQCTTWGHPVTTGLPTIDHYLSSALMEPDDADAHYTERLVRLPGLSVTYDPVKSSVSGPDRSAFGFPPDAVIYLAVQSLQKYLPQYDYVFPEIAKRVPQARFAFIEGTIPGVARMARFRIEAAFRRAGLSPEQHLIFLPSMDFERFQLLLRSGDVFLDSIEWSGANTSLEALRWDTPLVAVPGRFMRGRHSSAILTYLGLEDGLADDIEDYIEIASALGNDPDRRIAYRDAISNAKGRLSDDRSSVLGLMEYFEAAATAAANRKDTAAHEEDAPRHRQLRKAEDGLYRRHYASYDEYVAHQRDKLRHLDLGDYDALFERELGERLSRHGLVRRGDTVLCLGARLGTECRAFIAHGAVAIGIDLNPGLGNRHVVVGDFHDPQFADESFDLVYSNCLDHSFDLDKVMAGADRVLKRGGAFVADIMNGAGDSDAWAADGYDCLFWDSSADIIERLKESTGFELETASPMKSVWGWSGQMVVLRKSRAE